MEEERKEATEEKAPTKEERLASFREVFRTFIITAVITAIVSIFVRITNVNGDSMNETLHNGDKLLMTCVNISPERGDIIVFDTENYGKTLIKRVIAVEGDTIDIDFEAGAVTLNGEVLDEPYIKELTYERENAEIEYPLTVPEGCVFAMGDNRNHSTDSRQVGCVPVSGIKGVVFWRFLPVTKFGSVD